MDKFYRDIRNAIENYANYRPHTFPARHALDKYNIAAEGLKKLGVAKADIPPLK